ncbi:MAG: hypothetical protein IIA49_14805 [Bacteroidetes bacterium]|nr:hypothetical protein [Bacteroidota bacterium]
MGIKKKKAIRKAKGKAKTAPKTKGKAKATKGRAKASKGNVIGKVVEQRKYVSLTRNSVIGAMAKAIPKTQAKKKTKPSEDDDTGPRYTSRSKKRK